MAIPFPKNSNAGYLHYDVISGGEWKFLGGGDSNDIDNWLLDGGRLISHPDTTGWGTRQAGANWYNISLGGFFGWNGTVINLLGTASQAVVTPATSSSILVGGILLSRGPTADQTLAGPEVVANNMSATVSGAGGIITLRGLLSLQNQTGGAATFTIYIAKNGTKVATTIRNYGLSSTDINALTAEYVDVAAVITDVYTIRIAGGGAGAKLRAGECVLEAEARSTGMTLS